MKKYKYLDKINYPPDLKNLKSGELDKLNIKVKKAKIKKNFKKGIF